MISVIRIDSSFNTGAQTRPFVAWTTLFTRLLHLRYAPLLRSKDLQVLRNDLGHRQRGEIVRIKGGNENGEHYLFPNTGFPCPIDTIDADPFDCFQLSSFSAIRL
jgi:hypothetical protein